MSSKGNGIFTLPPLALAVLFSTLPLFLFSACPFGAQIVVKIHEPDLIPVTGVSLNESALTVTAETTKTLTATVMPDDADNKAVTWSSSNSSVATVDNGTVTIVALGIAIITVTTVDGGYTDECEFAVIPAEGSTLTPIAAGDYTERVSLFIISIDGFANDADADNAGLIITPVNGLSFSGHDAKGSASDGTKTFTVFVTYDGVQAFPNGTAAINITGITNTPSNFTFSGAITKSVRIIDGQAANRAIPVNQTNIRAFNTYADTTDGLTRHYQLAENVTLTVPEQGGSNWTAIGAYWTVFNVLTRTFTGSFDGQGYTIANLTINASAAGTEGVGMFGFIGANSVVKNLGLMRGSVKNSACNTGGIVGWNRGGTVQNCYVTGNIVSGIGSDSASIGGVVGHNSDNGIVKDCYASGIVSSGNYIGGVVGYNFGGGTMVQDCYATSTVIDGNYAGGVVGYNSDGGTVQNCYAAGSVNANDNFAGGVVGWNRGGTIRNCVALNSSIDRSSGNDTNFGRVLGYHTGGGNISNNYGRDGMRLPSGVTVINPNAGNIHGQNITAADWNRANWWQDTQFSRDVWELGSGLPTLKNTAGAQNPTIPE